ncbi:uncharacterized protein UHOD_11782 [Ustilago sp. UG-2017b]|nr:uncharacterized protein UHOD_11782 [Ustilago sp. UG-2017b]
MLGKASIDQALHLKENGLYYHRKDKDVNLGSRHFDRALEHAQEHGLKYVDAHDGKLYFYSIIQPHTDLGLELGLESKLGKHGYSSVLWEYNKEHNKLDIVSVARVKPIVLLEEVSDFHWNMQPFKEALELVH